MGSPHTFGIFRPRKRLSDCVYQRIEHVARANGAALCGGSIPGKGLQYWFTCDNLGEPFNSGTAKGTLAALAALGINVKEL